MCMYMYVSLFIHCFNVGKVLYLYKYQIVLNDQINVLLNLILAGKNNYTRRLVLRISCKVFLFLCVFVGILLLKKAFFFVSSFVLHKQCVQDRENVLNVEMIDIRFFFSMILSEFSHLQIYKPVGHNNHIFNSFGISNVCYLYTNLNKCLLINCCVVCTFLYRCTHILFKFGFLVCQVFSSVSQHQIQLQTSPMLVQNTLSEGYHATFNNQDAQVLIK